MRHLLSLESWDERRWNEGDGIVGVADEFDEGKGRGKIDWGEWIVRKREDDDGSEELKWSEMEESLTDGEDVEGEPVAA